MSYELPPLPQRPRDIHKHACGRILVVAGSMGMTGAGALAAMAALRSGAGLVTWAVPEPLAQIAEIKCTETITWPLPASEGGTFSINARELICEASLEMDAMILGPGIAGTAETSELIRLVVPEIHCPLVLDASGLTAMADHLDILMKRSKPTVLTPHAGELARMINKNQTDINAAREPIAKKLAMMTRTVLLLKGAGTIITDGQRVRVNETGNPGMATAGSGDVLAGVIAALLAMKLSPMDAAALGAHLHGLAGDIAAQSKGIYGLIAGDILEALPQAFLSYQPQ